MEKQEKRPNSQLRRERELRGWSQRAVAERVGTSEQVVVRWESGQHKPNRYFQTALCNLFGKNAEELGRIATLTNITERRFNGVEQRLDKIEEHLGELEKRFSNQETKIDRLESKFDDHTKLLTQILTHLLEKHKE